MGDADTAERENRNGQWPDARYDVCVSSTCIRCARLYRMERLRDSYVHLAGGDAGPERATSRETWRRRSQARQPPGQPGSQGQLLGREKCGRRGNPEPGSSRRHLRRRSDQDLGERAKHGATRASPSLSFWGPTSARQPQSGVSQVTDSADPSGAARESDSPLLERTLGSADLRGSARMRRLGLLLLSLIGLAGCSQAGADRGKTTIRFATDWRA